MKSLKYNKKTNQTFIEEKTMPSVDKNFDTLIKVSLAGICKTDVYVSQGYLTNKEDVILGHEFSGFVMESLNDAFKEGDFVTCNPIMPDNTMLGVDYDGAFSEAVKVPSSQCYKIPCVDEKLAAYIEPIAASLGPLNCDTVHDTSQKGAIIGKGRIPRLTEKVLRAKGVNVTCIDAFQNEMYDFIIETWANSDLLDKALAHLKQNGTLILKSRSPEKVPLDLYKVVRKEIQLKGCYYYDFQKSVEFAMMHPEFFEDLLGDVYSLNEWQEAFEMSMNADKKLFIRPD